MDDICRTYGLRPLQLVDKPFFDAAFRSLRRPLSEYTFANTFIWRTGEKLYWAPIQGHLCVFADGEGRLDTLATEEGLAYYLRSPRVVSLVAEADGEIIGWAVTLLRRHPRGTSARLYSLAVDASWRNRGVGERLARHMLEQLESIGIYRCRLEVREDNGPAIRLYESLGFRSVRFLPDYYGEGIHGRRMLYNSASFEGGEVSVNSTSSPRTSRGSKVRTG